MNKKEEGIRFEFIAKHAPKESKKAEMKDYIAWWESKISGKSFAEVLKAKAKKQTVAP